MKKTGILAICILLLLLLAGGAAAETVQKEAVEITASCQFNLNGSKKPKNVTDHFFTTYWEANNVKDPYVTITSEEPMYGLYLCFRTNVKNYGIPDYEIQADRGNGWEKLLDGNTDCLHMFYELDGETRIRIQAVSEKKTTLGFNEISVFGEGQTPEWVQRWEPTPEKTDLMFVFAQPDDELLFLGGSIPVYAVERKHSTAVVCLAYDNPSRLSELLNSLWYMGYRYYPLISGQKSLNSKNEAAVLDFTADAIRRYRPEVVVTLDEKGEGNGQRKLAAGICRRAVDQAEENSDRDGWETKKLYMHLYGDDPTMMDWDQPLESQKGLSAFSTIRYAFFYYKTQEDTSNNPSKPSVLTTGIKYENNRFGLVRSLVGPDVQKNDFLENIPEEALTKTPELPDLTVDKTAGILPELNAKGFIDEGEFIHADDATGIYAYISPTLKVIINRHFDGALPLTWFETEIWCDTEAGELIRNIEMDPAKRDKVRVDAAENALAHHVVFGFNGDYYTYRIGAKNGHPVGIEIRNGEIYYDDMYTEEIQFFPNLDTLAFYPDGRVDVHHSYEVTPKEYLERGAYNVYSFGPYLIRDGKLSEWVQDSRKSRAKNPRHAFGMIEPGHYVDIMCEGRLGTRSEGVTMPQIAFLAQQAGCVECCNLDGGQTAVVLFMGKQLNRIGEYNKKTSARPTCEIMGVGISEQVGSFEVVSGQ